EAMGRGGDLRSRRSCGLGNRLIAIPGHSSARLHQKASRHSLAILRSKHWRPLYRTYEAPRASLSNSYALLSTLMASTQFKVERRHVMDDKGEPPPTTRAKSLFRIGRNSHGNWVVQDQSGLCGGLFVDRAEAGKFAMFENGNRPQGGILGPRLLELDMRAQAPDPKTPHPPAPLPPPAPP